MMTKTEGLVIISTLGVIFTSAFFNFGISQVKARDIQRKNDLKHIRAALDNYYKDFKEYPLSQDGKIVACGEIQKEEAPKVCEWGEGSVGEYITPLPRDPQSAKRRTYIYKSNTKQFQLFASLEQKNEIEYNKKLEKKGLFCGSHVCNFGITSSLDISILDELPGL